MRFWNSIPFCCSQQKHPFLAFLVELVLPYFYLCFLSCNEVFFSFGIIVTIFPIGSLCFSRLTSFPKTLVSFFLFPSPAYEFGWNVLSAFRLATLFCLHIYISDALCHFLLSLGSVTHSPPLLPSISLPSPPLTSSFSPLFPSLFLYSVPVLSSSLFLPPFQFIVPIELEVSFQNCP